MRSHQNYFSIKLAMLLHSFWMNVRVFCLSLSPVLICLSFLFTVHIFLNDTCLFHFFALHIRKFLLVINCTSYSICLNNVLRNSCSKSKIFTKFTKILRLGCIVKNFKIQKKETSECENSWNYHKTMNKLPQTRSNYQNFFESID